MAGVHVSFPSSVQVGFTRRLRRLCTGTPTNIGTVGSVMPPAAVHSGEAHELRRKRNDELGGAYSTTPERFVNGIPKAPALPVAVWINKPKETEAELLTTLNQ
jgi:hypothetical protein